MENAADALKMAGFMFLFIMALTIGIFSLSQAKATAESIIYTRDDRSDYTYVSELNGMRTQRVVALDNIIPTIYRYRQENYRVEFVGLTDKLYTGQDGTNIYSLDLDEERIREEQWIGNQVQINRKLNQIIDNLRKRYTNRLFKEEIGVYKSEDEINQQTEKRLIRYTLQ